MPLIDIEDGDEYPHLKEAIEETRRNIRAAFAKLDAQVIKDDEWLATGRIRLKRSNEPES